MPDAIGAISNQPSQTEANRRPERAEPERSAQANRDEQRAQEAKAQQDALDARRAEAKAAAERNGGVDAFA